MEAACPYPAVPTTIEHQWRDQKSTRLFPNLPTSILIFWSYHHITALVGPKLHTVNLRPSNLHSYLLHPFIMSDENLFRAFMGVFKNSSTLRTYASRYNFQSRIIRNLLDEYDSRHISRTRQEKEPLVDTNNQN